MAPVWDCTGWRSAISCAFERMDIMDLKKAQSLRSCPFFHSHYEVSVNTLKGYDMVLTISYKVSYV